MLDFLAFVFVAWAFFGSVMAGKHVITEGGTKMTKVPKQILIVISDASFFGDDPKPDCVAVYIGGFDSARDQRIALTSPYCDIEAYAEVRTSRQDIIRGYPTVYGNGFRIAIIQLDILTGEPDIAEVQWDKEEFQRQMREGSQDLSNIGFGFAASTNPILVYTLSLNQTDCPVLFRKLRLDSWPYELPEGGFCVSAGGTLSWPTISGIKGPILPALPCDDALGSPVLEIDFKKVLGIIIWTVCAESVAFAISPAYMTDVVIPTSRPTTKLTTTARTKSTVRPPPLPRIPLTTRPCSDSSMVIDCYSRWSTIIVLVCGFHGSWL